VRLVIVGCLLLLSTTAAAQSRWTLSAGPEWAPFPGNQFIGGRVRGEYDLLVPTKPLRLRLELGGYWEPTQDRFVTSIVDGSTFGRTQQSVDISFGFSVAVTPLPRARFAPYLTLGILARQTWIRGFDSRFPASGGQPSFSRFSGTFGDLVYPVGIGVRARLGGRTLQFELRRFLAESRNAAMVGTSLPF
jgi:hypothetical protein